MTVFISVDDNNNITGFRQGFFDSAYILPGEFDVTLLDLRFDSLIGSKYDPINNQITYKITIDPVLVAYMENQFPILIQQALDAKAQEYHYDNIIAAISYTSSPNETWAKEAQAFQTWRFNVWTWYTNIVNDMQNEKIITLDPYQTFKEMPPFKFDV